MTLHPACVPTSSTAPRPRQLRDPLLRVLGRHTQFKPNVFVPMSSVLDDVIREAGFDPDNLPAQWGRDSKSRANNGEGAGIYRNISFAFRYGYRDYNPALTVRGPKMRDWGLTETGVQAVQALLAHDVLPRPRVFAEPLLRAMAKITHYTLTPVPRLDAMRATLLEAGYNPDALPKGWDDAASNNQPKIHEALRWVARSMSTLITSPTRGVWALTPLGLERAAQITNTTLRPTALTATPKASTRPNVTSQWFAKHLKPKPGERQSQLMSMMRGSLCRKMTVSADRDLIDDHIQNFMVRIIRTDGLAPTLNAGEEVDYHRVVAYCLNSSRSDIRDMGTEPVCRTLYGAQTDTERARNRTQEPSIQGFEDRLPIDTDGNLYQHDEVDAIVQDTPPSHLLDFESIWQRVVAVVQAHKPVAWPRYTHIVQMRAEGYSTDEIAADQKVSRHRAAKMLATVRDIVRSSCGGDVLAFIS